MTNDNATFPGQPIHEPQRTLKVLVVGAGASGLLVAYKLQRHFDRIDLQVFEKNPAVSGTWFENTYPGCACDVPAHCLFPLPFILCLVWPLICRRLHLVVRAQPQLVGQLCGSW